MTSSDQKATARDSSGRFCNFGAYQVPYARVPSPFTPASEARKALRTALEDADRTLRQMVVSEGVPSAVIRASPGAGKSTIQRELMGERLAEGDDRAIAFHVPTLDLAEEASTHAAAQGLQARAIRGRSARNPEGNGPMCVKAELVAKANRIGISAGEHFCKMKAEDGSVIQCCHFDACAYVKQFETEASCHFLATAYLSLPNPAALKPSLRVIDETFWGSLLWIKDVDVVSFKAPRTSLAISEGAAYTMLLTAAAQVVGKLCSGESPLTLPYTVSDYTAFAQLERKAQAPGAEIRPDQDIETQKRKLDAAEGVHHKASRFAAIWEVLGEAKQKNLADCERLRLFANNQTEFLRISRCRPLEHKEPILILDADADTEILDAIGCDVQVEHRLSLRPNAHIVQVHDQQMSSTALLKSEQQRQGFCRVIAREVLRDQLSRKEGVLVGATKKVVRKIFEDAGWDFSAKSDEEISQILLNTKLHGADWLWFGGRSLGSNRYKGCGTVIVLGRQELPISDLEDQGRAFWGDTANSPLELVAPDLNGKHRLPLTEVPYEMADHSRFAVMVPCHPDSRIRRLQLQSRELATRQLVERLRLAHARFRKRVILVCNIPIPGLPVNELVTWNELQGDRIEAAIALALVDGRMVKFDYKGIAAGAPSVFKNEHAVKGYLKRNKASKRLLSRFKEAAKTFGGTLHLEDCAAIVAPAEDSWSVEDLTF
ncbi:hypothetical protein HKX23_03150 [Sulfitobacter sp. KE29]|uniref:hypothetical protein n=1 Tax=unclassified Sulfitobacter TaxID=196795 RepID=UPI0023E20B09|nr:MULTISPECIES: hypothetical protein [unclassified Sulfitobacter]MDF3417340.1 hypothetical protein [Sulfitobacter sp. Ks38]MDF3424822.1 hypothetical protein [Sulfitobacter sp. KE29]MDF3428402.1 hypothetical protein [Sulfitobacter sp. S46]MDF3443174.1 hypothetical protein [Sulfitobacter sp. KE31]MDF3547200.1 hypothetical protein [Sulfitobacter sp. KE28]